MLLVLYVGGVGPLAALAKKGTIKESNKRWLGMLYAPLELGVKKTSLKKPMDDYIDWWCDRLGVKPPPPAKP